MLFYASLFLLCSVVSCVALWVFRSFREAGTDIFGAFRPNFKGKIGAEEASVHLGNTLESTLTPWGWKSANAARPAKAWKRTPGALSAAAAQWGWRGGNSVVDKTRHAVDKLMSFTAYTSDLDQDQGDRSIPAEIESNVPVGWPYRKEIFEIDGPGYTGATMKKLPNVKSGSSAKPWGW